MKKDAAPIARAEASKPKKPNRPKTRAPDKMKGGGRSEAIHSDPTTAHFDTRNFTAKATQEKPVTRKEANKNHQRLIKQLGDAASHFLPGSKTMYSNSPHWWDSFLLHAKSEPEAARTQMMVMGRIVRGSIQSLVEWAATTAHLPDVQAWAQTCLADVVTWLEDFGYVDLKRSPESYGGAFRQRWKTLHPDGRGPSKFAVVEIFADELLRKSDAMLDEILESYPEALPNDASASKKALWTFVNGHVKWRFKNGDQSVRSETVRYSLEFFRNHETTADIIWKEHLWPLMQETWPRWIREPGREEFVGPGDWKMGLPLKDAKRKNGKLCLEPSQWKDAVHGHIKKRAMFQNLFFGHGGQQRKGEQSDAPPES